MYEALIAAIHAVSVYSLLVIIIGFPWPSRVSDPRSLHAGSTMLERTPSRPWTMAKLLLRCFGFFRVLSVRRPGSRWNCHPTAQLQYTLAGNVILGRYIPDSCGHDHQNHHTALLEATNLRGLFSLLKQPDAEKCHCWHRHFRHVF